MGYQWLDWGELYFYYEFQICLIIIIQGNWFWFCLLHFACSSTKAFISVRRLSRFLCCSEYKRESEKKVESPMLFPKDNSEYISEDIAFLMHDACCTWSSSDEEKRNMVLNNINLSLPKGLLIAVIGEVISFSQFLLLQFKESIFIFLNLLFFFCLWLEFVAVWTCDFVFFLCDFLNKMFLYQLSFRDQQK